MHAWVVLIKRKNIPAMQIMLGMITKIQVIIGMVAYHQRYKDI
jgi:hypothetical protein